MLLGPTEAGKSSMVESLIAGKAVLLNVHDRTQVISLKQWNITEKDIIHIYDHGGHMIYSITSPLFISKASVVFIVHDVTKVQPKNVAQTTQVLQQTLHQYPDNEMYIVLTHTDLLHADQVTTNSGILMAALKGFLDKEINNLSKLQKQHDIAHPTGKLLMLFRAKRSNLSFFCVSSVNYSGMEEVKDFLVNIAKEKRIALPESWVKFYRQIIGANKIYLTLEEIMHLFQTSTETKQQGSNYMVPLQYFADTNLCLHYQNNTFLKDYVFPDIDFLVDLFKCLFHHNIAEVINYDTDEKLQAKFKKPECDLTVKRYQKEGLLSKKLLSYLWEHYKLSVTDEEVLLQLMQSFNLCHSISKDEDLQYFPWFVQLKQCPPHIDRDRLMQFDKEHSSVHLQCQFFNQIPVNVFEMISVCLQRKATQECHYMGDRQAWYGGLEISFGSVRCVLTLSDQNSTIDICLYGKIEDVPELWTLIASLLRDLQSILNEWDGVIRSIHFVCGHCIIFHISPPNHWLPDQVIPQKHVLVPDFVQCPMAESKDIPAALIMDCFKGENVVHMLGLISMKFGKWSLGLYF